MNVQARYPTTADEFLRWNEGREGKWDYVDGRIVDMMVRVSRIHAALTTQLLLLLKGQLPQEMLVTAADFGVQTKTSVRYPDVLVDGPVGDHKDLAATAPVLIAEVLSPSTMDIDLGVKAAEYKTIDSLLHYIVLSQDDPRVWMWTRLADGWAGPDLVVGLENTIPLPGLGISLPMADLYRDFA